MAGLLRRSQSHRAGTDCSRAAAWPECEGRTPQLLRPPALQSPASVFSGLSRAGSQAPRWPLGHLEMRLPRDATVGPAPHGRVKQGTGQDGAGSKQAKTANYRLGRKNVRSIVHGFRKTNSRSIKDLNIRNKRIEGLKKYRRIWLQPWSTQRFEEHTN